MEENITKQTLEIAEKKLQLLKAQCKNTQMSIRTTLELASQIRDSISNDKDLTEFCNANKEYALQRQKLLDEIRKMQLDIIAKYTKQYKDLGNFNGNVKDFSKAKQDLVAMIEGEQALHIFAETESPELFKTIDDCKIHEQTLRNTADDCKNGRYKVLIMGDFQSGKSTTVDALCDGRHVCAIGKGVATSAVLVTVTYADEEHTEIHWRTKEQLVGIFAKVKQYLPDYDLDTFDLGNPQARHKLAEAISTLRTSKKCPNVSDGDAKFLMLCDFILHYYDTDELAKKKEAQQTSADSSEITKFPEKGEALWKKLGVSGFTIDEVLFVFIDKVDCFVHSETLRELNCTIIDSPGLFNSSYDTMVTEQAMVEAHAIMYVLPYTKAMSQDVCASLYKIKNNYSDVHRKLFIVNNSKPGQKKVFESNCEKIKDMFGTEKNVYRYDAKLAYLLQVKGLFDTGRASENDYRHLLGVTEESYDEDAEMTFDTFDEAWTVHIARYAGTLKGYYARILQGHIEEGLRVSGFIDMIVALRNFIEGNEAYAVIVSNGLAPMTREISAIKSGLYRGYIKPYLSSQEEREKLWKGKIEKAKDFQNFVSVSLHKAIFEGENSLLMRMTQEEYTKLFTEDFYTDLSCEIAGVIYDNKKTLLSIKSLFKKSEYKTKLITKLTPLIQKKIIDIVSGKIKYLNSLIESKQDRTVTNIFVPVVDNVELRLLQEWHKQYDDSDDFKMQDYLILSKGLNLISKDSSSLSTYNAGDLSDNTDRLILFKGFISEICTIVAGLVSMIAGYIALVFTDPTGVTETIAIAIAGVLGLLGGFVAIIAPDWARDKSVKMLGSNLVSKIKTNETIRGFNSLVKNQLESILTKYIAAQTIDIQKMENERDLALHPTADREMLCFRSIEATERLNERLQTYDKYKLKYLTYETT